MKKPIWRILLFATCFAGHVAKIHAQEEITDTIMEILVEILGRF